MGVVSMVVGGTTPSGARFVAKVDTGPVRVAVALDEAMTSPVFTASVAVDADNVAKLVIAGLDAATQYWWQVEDNSVLDVTVTGRFRTLPAAGVATTFTVACIGDAGLDPVAPGEAGGELDPDRVSNHPAFDTVRTLAHANGWLGVAHLGDAHYYNFGVDFTATIANYRRAWDDILAQPNAARLLRELPLLAYVWDDHDFDGDNGDGTFADKANAAQVARERTPFGDFAAEAGPLYRSFRIDRTLFVVSDTRYHRSPNSDPDGPSKTMLGVDQKAWLQALLSTSDAKALVWLMPTPWLGTIADTWGGFATERTELADMLTASGWAHRTVMVNPDVHAIGLSSPGGNPHGGWPILLCASIDATPSEASGAQYDLGFIGGRNQFGTVEVADAGTLITVTLTGWQGTSQALSFTYGIAGDPAPSAAVGALTRTLSGSHRVVFEARVLSTFQTGPAPDGEPIDLIDGVVEMDGTADVERTLTSTVDGHDLFPRRTGDLLLPDGQEIWVRRGVDLGSEILWTPLGFFRIDDDDQDDAPDGPIRLTCFDRMAAIIDAELLSPKQFAATRTFRGVFMELVGEVYPDAVILFDDELGQEQIGRLLIVERSRYEPLRTLVQGRGKIMRWDGEGVLRILTAPDPDVPVWEVNAGASGVLARASRRITRRDVVNAVVFRSQGGDTLPPVRAVAIDDGPHSLTRFGGRFGIVPEHISMPAQSTIGQAQQAVRATLLRRAGLPYQVEFAAVPNQALVPYDPVRVTYRNGDREKHVVERLTMPLTAEALMTGRTREQRSSRVVVAPL